MRQHLIEVIAIDQDRFAPLKRGVEYAPVLAAAEVAENRDVKWIFGFGPFNSFSPFTRFDRNLRERWPWHDFCNVIAIGAENRGSEAVENFQILFPGNTGGFEIAQNDGNGHIVSRGCYNWPA